MPVGNYRGVFVQLGLDNPAEHSLSFTVHNADLMDALFQASINVVAH
jgi:hypothetical protein